MKKLLAVAVLTTARYNDPGAGVQTAGLVIGGSTDPGAVTNTEEWSGIVAQTKTVTVS